MFFRLCYFTLQIEQVEFLYSKLTPINLSEIKDVIKKNFSNCLSFKYLKFRLCKICQSS
ncbi:hypothetical protein EA683_18040 [Acinetobacter baumannii]|nr:hypothetical protein EA683_18040 [Acinetobacter baumannii]